jgi:Kef-type K+ transport system membrane component KefB
MIVLSLTRVLGKLLAYIKQPPVIGEIIAGIILGPSVMGYADGWTAAIFPTNGMVRHHRHTT